jgi:hypothetical protein
MLCETEQFRTYLKDKTNYRIALLTSEFVSCSTDDDDVISYQLAYWRDHIIKQSNEGTDLICQLNKGNVLILLHPSHYNEFRQNLETSIISFEENSSLVLRYHFHELIPEKAEYLLTFF